jgi:5-methylthioribose kinase
MMSAPATTGYQTLTEETVVKIIEPLRFFTGEGELRVKEIGDGNLNLVFHLTEPASGKSLIVKQALPYAKVVGESWPLSLDRARIESEALKKAAEFVPDLVPKVLYSNAELAVTVMEDLSDHTILRKGLIAGNQYPKLAEHVGTFLAQTLFHTSDFYLHPFAKKALVQSFINPDLCKITEDLVFTDPFFDHETNDFPDELRPDAEALWGDQELKREVAQLKLAFLTRAEVLVHGDLHSGSIFVTGESTKMIDPEFAYYGPAGFDHGHFFANLALSALSHNYHTKEPGSRSDYQEWLFSVIRDTWHHFAEQFGELWKNKGTETYTKVPGTLNDFLQQTWTDAIGFAGCEIIRRTIGLAHVADLDSIEDQGVQIELKRRALRLGSSLIKRRNQLPDVESFIAALKGGI